MVKILYLFEHLKVGGAEQLLLTTLKYLDRDKFYPVVYCLNEKGQIGNEIEKIGIKIGSLNKNIHLFNATIIYDLIRIFGQEKPDIIHTNLFFSNIFGRIAAKLAGIKTVITTLHNPDYTFEDNGKLAFKIRKAIDRETAKVSRTSFIAVSEFVKNDFLKQLKFENIRVLYNYIDTTSYKIRNSKKCEEKRNELGLTSGDMLILNVGRLHPQKGQAYLVEAFNLVSKGNPQLKLIIIGKGIMRNELKKKVADLSIADKVIFLEDRRDIPEIMAISDIFVFPSLYEGFGIALVEAMAAGLGIIASEIEPLREIVTDKKEAILLERKNPKILAEAISELIRDEKLRRYLGENARKKAFDLFDAKRLVKKLEAFYQETFEKAKTNGGFKLQNSFIQENISCIVCGGIFFKKTIYGGYFYDDKKYDIVRCSKCGFMFLNPLPDKAALDKIYNSDGYFDFYYVTSAGKRGYIEAMTDYLKSDDQIISCIKKYKKSGLLLDLGCAAGRFLINARDAGFEVMGIEPSVKMVEHARDKLYLNVIHGTLEDFSEQRRFDVIHAGDVLEHILELKKSMQILNSLLADDGILIINQPLMYNKSLSNLFLKINMSLKKERHSTNPPTHLWEFNSVTLKMFLQKFGFKIIYYRISESAAKPLNIHKNPTIKNVLGIHIKNFSSLVSNSLLLKTFEFGDRAIIVCKK